MEPLGALPPEAADQAIAWATRLRDLANRKHVDWSATWIKEGPGGGTARVLN